MSILPAQPSYGGVGRRRGGREKKNCSGTDVPSLHEVARQLCCLEWRKVLLKAGLALSRSRRDCTPGIGSMNLLVNRFVLPRWHQGNMLAIQPRAWTKGRPARPCSGYGAASARPPCA